MSTSTPVDHIRPNSPLKQYESTTEDASKALPEGLRYTRGTSSLRSERIDSIINFHVASLDATQKKLAEVQAAGGQRRRGPRLPPGQSEGAESVEALRLKEANLQGKLEILQLLKGVSRSFEGEILTAKSMLDPCHLTSLKLAACTRIAIYRSFKTLTLTSPYFNLQLPTMNEPGDGEPIYLGDLRGLMTAAKAAIYDVGNAALFKAVQDTTVAGTGWFDNWAVAASDPRSGHLKLLAMLLPLLSYRYGREKYRVSRWLKSHASSVAVDDYDSQKERGQDIRVVSTLPSDVTPAHQHVLQDIPTDVSGSLTFLETVAPGLLMLLNSEFVKIASEPPLVIESLAPDDVFIDLSSLSEEDSINYEHQLSNHPNRDNYLALFRVFSGRDYGPWSRALPGGALKELQEALFVKCKDKGTVIGQKRRSEGSAMVASSSRDLSTTSSVKRIALHLDKEGSRQ